MLNLILAVITVLLLISRVKGTPEMLSKKRYMEKAQKAVEKRKETMAKDTTDEKIQMIRMLAGNESLDSIYQGAAVILSVLFYGFLSVYYLLVGFRSDSGWMHLLSILQIATCIWNCREGFQLNPYSLEAEQFPFHRWFFLCNLVLDYIYYPAALYLLLRG